MRRRDYAPDSVEAPDPEIFDAPRTLTAADLRAQTGLDGRREAERPDMENEQ
jgi:hypothetical protein